MQTMDLQALFDQAMAAHRQGNLAAADQMYRQVLRVAPGTAGAHYLLGALQAQQGRNADALASYERALSLQPGFSEVLYAQGVLLWQMGRPADALKSYDGFLAIRPGHVEALFNRGVVLADLTRFEDAVQAYDQALAIQPNFLQAIVNRAVALWKLRLFDAALAGYDRALALEPGHADAHYNRALVLADMGRQEEALAAYDRALALAPQSPDMLASRGVALMDLRRLDEALANFDESLALRPGDVETWSNRGLVLWALHRGEEAVASYDKALAAAPGFAVGWQNRGVALLGLSRFAEALASFDHVVSLEPRNAEAWNHRGNALRELGRFEEAVTNYNTAIAVRPGFAEAHNNRGYTAWANLGLYDAAVFDYERALAIDSDLPYTRGELLQLKMYGADWRGHDAAVAAIDEGVRAGRRVARPFSYQAVSQSPADLQACSVIFANERYPELVSPFVHAKRERDKIRIGYVSSDFREQATSFLMAGLYEQHDKDKFEVVAFDNGYDDGSALRARVVAAFDDFIDISKLTDRDAAAKIQGRGIDILVNLNGYFGSPRMGVFARRPAPLQVNYLGFPATLGAAYIDYIIADQVVIPKDERQFYNEQVVWLPDSYQANDSQRPIGQDSSRATEGLPEQGFVFCNFNQSYKLTPQIFALWIDILKQAPGSVLWLLKSTPSFEVNLRAEAVRQGVVPQRLVFAPARLPHEHLARLKLADLFLDTLPYNAHTTASDALWAGLPLLTCRGTAFAGRVAASLLKAAGLPELITETPEAYVELAVALANDKAKMKKLRDKLGKKRLVCPLFDTQRFARHIESAYATMWEGWREGKAPRAFAVKPVK